MRWTRRAMLRGGAALALLPAAAALARRVPAAPPAAPSGDRSLQDSRRLVLHNLHTDEHLDTEYFRDGDYVPAALAALQTLLRDHRNGECHVIDPALLDYVYGVAQQLGAEPVYSVISGYRSPQTNEQLRERSSGVARHSLHLEGRAMDVRLARVDCATLAGHAQQLTRGGVGYYRASDFVHLDTGAFRTWRG